MINTQLSYVDLIYIKQSYEETSHNVIKDNIKLLMTSNNTSYSDLVSILGISTHTAYSYTNKANNNKPNLYNLLILSHYWKVSMKKLFS